MNGPLTLFKKKWILLSIIFVCLSPMASARHWQELAPGFHYLDLGRAHLTPWSHVHAFRIDLKKYQFNLIMATALSKPHATADQFALHSHALLTINGGFFDQNYHPLGLRISNQQQYSPLKHISWWGVFYIKDDIPHIAGLGHYKHDKQIEFAVQSGPRLLVNGHIPPLKPGLAERSALGISPKGDVIIVITNNAPMTTTALAELMQSPPLNCKEALNLDGGSSTQLHARIGDFKMNVFGFSNVSDAISVVARE
jgi:uncharacterized protein YigE (DUF2233 family)